jgi:acyl-CoA reductase-like NAD-dependent aldehyde dehydrogenase
MVTGFVEDADVVRMANLAVADKAAFIFTRDAGRGYQVADRLRASTNWVNLRGPLPVTFDSASDFWRLERHTRLKSICVDLSQSGSG